MKKTIILSAIILIAMAAQAQNEEDALRFSQIFYGGTARSVSMGSAFGALGGDFSSISINPAGLGVYRKGELTITPVFTTNGGTSDYLGSSYKDSRYNFLLNNLGFVSTFNTNKEQGWVSTSLAFGYTRNNDFNRNIQISAVNNKSSLLDEFVQNANGKYPSDLTSGSSAYYENLALQTDVIYNPDTTVTPPQYTYDAMNQWGMRQDKSIVTTGGTSEYNFSFAANYSNRLYLGMSLGIEHLNYNEYTSYTETDITGTIPFLNSYTFNQSFSTYGTGYNFKFGAIFKPIEMLRIGAAVHLPTFYSLHSTFSTSMDANFKHVDGFADNTSAQSPIAINTYSLNTPFRYNGSVALLLGQMGLVSMDYEYVDYSSMRMRSNYDPFLDVNSNIQKYYKSTSNLRLGGELKLGTFALRGGYSLYGSPYTKGYGNDNAGRNTLSAGIGFRSSSFFLDLGYAYSWQKQNHILYEYVDGVQTIAETANLNLQNSQVLATFGFRF